MEIKKLTHGYKCECEKCAKARQNQRKNAKKSAMAAANSETRPFKAEGKVKTGGQWGQDVEILRILIAATKEGRMPWDWRWIEGTGSEAVYAAWREPFSNLILTSSWLRYKDVEIVAEPEKTELFNAVRDSLGTRADLRLLLDRNVKEKSE